MNLIISYVTEEAAGIKTFGLRSEDESPIRYRPGQFLTIQDSFGGHVFRRSYSFSSAPGVDETAAITVRRVANGVLSRRLIDRAVAGDVLQTAGPATGVFTLPGILTGINAIWLFAAGIGITPIFSLLKHSLHHTRLNVVLVYSNRSPEETVFYSSLTRLENEFGCRLRIIWFWSNARNLHTARLSRESFNALLATDLNRNQSSALYYTCGPPDYMWLTQLLLQTAGVPDDAIRREIFSFEREIPRALPPDTGEHSVTAQIADREYVFVSRHPETILAASKRAGVPLPYSCESGQCGSCAARCVRGKVWMSYNEVLTDRDVAEGSVLTCTGHAAGGDLVLQFDGVQ